MRTGLAVFDENQTLKLTHTIECNVPDRYDRTKKLLCMVMFFLEELHLLEASPDLQIICEEPTLQGKASLAMNRLLGGLEVLFETKMKYVSPMTVKAKMGDGRWDKLEVALGAGEFLKTEEEREILADCITREDWDSTDAIAIGLTHFIKEQ